MGAAPMRLLVDGVVFESTHQKGIRRYVQEVLARTEEEFSLLMHKPVAGSVPTDWDVIPPLEPFSASRLGLLSRWRYREKAKGWRRRILSYDVFHSTFYRMCPVPGIPTVVTVYDMVTEAMPYQYWGDAGMDSLMKMNAIAAADAVITISETTKRDLLKLFPNIKAKVHAIPLGADHFDVATAADNVERSGGAPYALFVGDRVGYKNFQTLLEAMRDGAWPGGVRLKVAGPKFSEAEHACLRFMELEKQVEFCGLVSNEELAVLYADAVAFVFPSLFEGFGLPMLEAQARRAVVVANDMAVFHEVGGDAFIPCDCRNPAAMARGVAEAMAPAMRDRLISRGTQNVKRFTWAEAAKRTQDVYRECAEMRVSPGRHTS